MRKHDEHEAAREREVARAREQHESEKARARDAETHAREAAEREKQRAWDAQAPPRPSPKGVEIRPYVVRCGVCGLVKRGVLSETAAPGMPGHALQPGYQCMGSGVAGVVLGRGEVIEGAVVPVEAADVPGQWGQR